MKVSIITEALQNAGYGHLTRCLAIYQAFEARNIIPTFYVNGDEQAAEFLADTNHELIDWLEHQDILLKKIKDSDVVFLDSYKAPKEFYDQISRLTPSPVFFDDTCRIDFPPGIILNGGISAETLGYKKKDGTILLLGPRFAPLRKEFWDVPERPVKFNLQSVLITFGGNDAQNLTPRMMRILCRNFPELQKKVIVGGSFTNKEQILEAKDASTDIFYSPSALEMQKIMAECDLAISAAGQTINELARLGIPTIAIAVAENQLPNLSAWVKERFIPAELINTMPNLEHRLLLLFNNLRKKSVRDSISKIGKLKVDGAGAKRVVQLLIDKVAGRAGYYFRDVLPKDASMIFNLSNDRLVRANSINQDAINWGNHLDWFTGKLMDDDCLYKLAFSTADQFIGQVRFDIKGYYAEINISIDKDFRGKGYAKSIIFNASFMCFHSKPNVGYIHALIRPGNAPSMKAFLKAGYALSHKETVNNQEFIVYKLKR